MYIYIYGLLETLYVTGGLIPRSTLSLHSFVGHRTCLVSGKTIAMESQALQMDPRESTTHR